MQCLSVGLKNRRTRGKNYSTIYCSYDQHRFPRRFAEEQSAAVRKYVPSVPEHVHLIIF